MVLEPATVKGKRSYDASGRRAESRRTRDRITTTAERLFLRDGYAATTVGAIAGASDVSPDTIYKSFGGKPGLVRAIRDRALLGDGPLPAEQRSDRLHLDTADVRAVIRGWGALASEVAPRVVPILLLIRSAAATDPELMALLEEMNADRLRRMRDNARQLHHSGQLREDLTLETVADVLWTYSSPEFYELLVLGRGWGSQRYGRFIAAAMIDALL